jgi:DNA-binding MarR family transcriptional regulator
MDASEIATLIEKTARAVYEERGPRAIHPGQWAVLRFLAGAPHSDRTVGGIAQFLGVTHAPASRAVASLARKDLVQVQIDPFDRRIRRIDITGGGRELLARDPVQRLAGAISVLPLSDQEALARVLETLYVGLAGQSDRS